MPRVTVRLTDAQHDELVARARAAGRTMQKQMLHDLFDGVAERSGTGLQPQTDAGSTPAPVSGFKYPGRRPYKGPDLKPPSEKKRRRGR